VKEVLQKIEELALPPKGELLPNDQTAAIIDERLDAMRAALGDPGSTGDIIGQLRTVLEPMATILTGPTQVAFKLEQVVTAGRIAFQWLIHNTTDETAYERAYPEAKAMIAAHREMHKRTDSFSEAHWSASAGAAAGESALPIFQEIERPDRSAEQPGDAVARGAQRGAPRSPDQDRADRGGSSPGQPGPAGHRGARPGAAAGDDRTLAFEQGHGSPSALIGGSRPSGHQTRRRDHLRESQPGAEGRRRRLPAFGRGGEVTIETLRKVEELILSAGRGEDIPQTIPGKFGVLHRMLEKVQAAVPGDDPLQEVITEALEETRIDVAGVLSKVHALAVVGGEVSTAIHALGEIPKIEEVMRARTDAA
jgi:hypothetical protein